jgi:L-ascorbate metabolism protein UlaG (beta-lactamase superfamily)
MLSNVKWLGHASLMFRSTKTIYIDPFQINGHPADADLILITHDHYDHFSPADIQRIQHQDTIIVIPETSQKQVPGNVRKMGIGAIMQVAGIPVEAVPAYNINKPFHPASSGNVGYIVTLNGIRYYHAGDTDIIPEMETLNVDVAFLPVCGTYTMNPEEAARAAQILNPQIAVPIHYGSVTGTPEDGLKFQSLCKCPVTILPKTDI